MILVDTSVWVEHFRRGSGVFAGALDAGQVMIHTIVIGELATGNLHRRAQTLAALHALPRVHEGTHDECLAYLGAHRLFGQGLAWNDVQLLAAADLTHVALWTLDQPLERAAARMGLLHKRTAQ
jgi:predicted nucleic acid-binding protein